MLGNPGDATATSCTKGYRQLAAETRLDKDTVRDLIVEFKEKGIVRETATYDPDTRSSKTYEVLSYETALRMWREAGIQFVTTGRQRPLFCSALGELLTLKPTVGPNTAVGPVSR
jgi:DNA-binding IclR family transcriptional regulator